MKAIKINFPVLIFFSIFCFEVAAYQSKNIIETKELKNIALMAQDIFARGLIGNCEGRISLYQLSKNEMQSSIAIEKTVISMTNVYWQNELVEGVIEAVSPKRRNIKMAISYLRNHNYTDELAQKSLDDLSNIANRYYKANNNASLFYGWVGYTDNRVMGHVVFIDPKSGEALILGQGYCF